MRYPKVVALGGGHGLAASLAALRLVCEEITAVVTVADNGGSSGRLRDEFGILPPGDLRMALAALCDDSEWGHTWRDVLQHRYGGHGPLAGHAVGNLLITALWDLHEDPVRGLDLVGRLLGARGRVLPMAAVPLEMIAVVRGGDPLRPEESVVVRGQAEVATTPGTVESIAVEPPEPPACVQALHAVDEADWVVLGPGSWFTSVLPHLLVPALRHSLETTSAQRALTLNLQNVGETAGFSAVRHLEALGAHAPGLRIDAVIADPSIIDDEDELRRAAATLGARLAVAPVAKLGNPGQHDSLRLAAAYRDVLTLR